MQGLLTRKKDSNIIALLFYVKGFAKFFIILIFYDVGVSIPILEIEKKWRREAKK